ncbi:hypothetical protein ISS30_04305 [bacterium]|nr:hypothetical protein [bacterium]
MRIPKLLLPVLAVSILLFGYFLRFAFTQPTSNVSFDSEGGGKKLECLVEGVKCKGTASFFTSLYKNTEGIISIETYATEHLAVFTYNPQLITTQRIIEVMETPILLQDGSRRQVFKCLSYK